MNNAPFSLKKSSKTSALFMPPSDNSGTRVSIDINKLNHYHNHPFKLYQGQRLDDMVESVQANGIFMPLLVQPIGTDNEYEILSGHNRYESAKIAGLTEVPCIILHGLSKEDAYLIVTETNLRQRGVTEMSHTERAKAFATHYEAIKCQGKRTDLVRQMDALLGGGEVEDAESDLTSAPPGNKSLDVVGKKYELSKNTVARYIRLNSLVAGFAELLDSELLSIRAGVELSYLDKEYQEKALELITQHQIIPSLKQAEQIRALANETVEKTGLSPIMPYFAQNCVDILFGQHNYEKPIAAKKVLQFKFKRSDVESYLPANSTEDELHDYVKKALEYYSARG